MTCTPSTPCIKLCTPLNGCLQAAFNFRGIEGKRIASLAYGQTFNSEEVGRLQKFRATHSLPVVGSLELFRDMWNHHTEIKEAGAKGHPICEKCGEYQTIYDRLEGRTDAAAVQMRADADVAQEQHDFEHTGERNYAEDIWGKGDIHPELVTAMNMDAPTVSQFDIPVQKRVARDVTKRLETMLKWGSKVTGVMIAGFGMVTYLARAGLGSGANLSCTLMYLSLMKLAKSSRGLGSRYNLLMDNTSGDNKNAEMIIFLAWLVHNGVFKDASFFCQLKGHTFTVLDQSFNTLISQLLGEAIYTMSSLLSFIFKFLQPYGCHEVVEVHQLWDWNNFFKPHVERMAGFCTSQYGSGMHECYVRKDRNGDVRCWLRKSSKSSTWFPEGEGYMVFLTPPDEKPGIAKAHSDSSWGRAAVEATIRAWYNMMAVDSPLLSDIKREWELRFEQLPTNR